MKKFRTGLVGLLVAASVVFVPQASADPDAVSKAKEELDKIHEEASAIDAEIIEVASRAEEATTKLTQLNEDVSAQEKTVATLGTDLGDVALMQFNSGGLDVTAQLLSSESQAEFLSGLSAIQNEVDRSSADLQKYQLQVARLDSLRDQQSSITKSLEEDKAKKEKLAAEFDIKESEAQAIYDRLNAEEKERLRQLEEQRQREQEQREQEQRDNQSPSPRPSNGSSPRPTASPSPDGSETPEPEPPADPSPRGSSAVEIAMAQVGKSYVFGTAGPNTFDCSGLMVYSYKKMGVSLPRTSRAQFGAGTAVSKDNLQPGDLVFYYSGISHVGMYIGNGKIVHAANPRSGVKVDSLNSMPYQGARRVG